MVADDRLAVVVVPVVVRPVEERAPDVAVLVETGHVRVAVRILPLGANVSGITRATTP